MSKETLLKNKFVNKVSHITKSLSMFKEGVSDQQIFNEPFLLTNKSSAEFLHAISYRVDLTQLYKVVDSCYYDAQGYYCPVIVKIKDHLLREEFQYDYILQVWDRKGQKCYERLLKQKPKLWSINSHYLVYKTRKSDENSEYFHIINLKNGNATILLKDTINDDQAKYLAYNNGVLYLTSKNTAHLMECKHDIYPKKIEKREISGLQQQTVKIDTSIWALFTKIRYNEKKKTKEHIMIIALETKDSQLDFNELRIKNLGNKDFSYNLYQLNDVYARPVRQDEISKFCYKIDRTNTFYGLALRASAFFDIYWDMNLVHQQSRYLAVDIEMSDDTFYFKMPGGEIRSVQTNGPSTNFQKAFQEDPSFDFNIIFYQNIKNHVNLYNSFVLIRTELFVTHGSYVSIYNIQEQRWLVHIKFQEGEISKLMKKSRESVRGMKNELMVILENGSVYNNLLHLIKYNENLTASISDIQFTSLAQKIIRVSTGDVRCQDNNQNLNMKCKVLKVVNNSENNMQIFVLGEDEYERIKLFYINKNKLQEIRIGLDDTLDAQTNIAITNQLMSEDQLIVIQNKGNFSIYEVRQEHSKMEIDEFDENQDGNPELDDDYIDLTLKFRTNQSMVQGIIHSCVSCKNQHEIIIMDEFNFYKVNLENHFIHTIPNQNCVGISLIDEKYCYTLSHKSPNKQSGLRVYDLETLVNRNQDMSFFLQNAQVGVQNHIDWNPIYSRFTFLKSLDEMQIVPALHRSTMAFIGMGKRDDYLTTKVMRDKFLAVDKVKKYIYCWSNITTKLLFSTRLPSRQDYSEFSVYGPKNDVTYHREWYSKTLIMKNQPEKESNLKNLKNIIDTSQRKLQYQILYESQQEQEYREFRIIEIVNEKEVLEHAIFVHPYLSKKNQRLLFDNNLNFMLEIVDNLRVILYKRQEDKNIKKQVKWEFVKRFDRYPFDLETTEGFIRCLSPSFKNLIDVDLKNKDFIIRNAMSMQFQQAIPRYLMNIDEEPVQDIMKRFKWIDDTTIKIINREGIEKIIDINNRCEEKAYNVIPLYEKENLKDKNDDYYHNRKSLALSQVKERLIRKYQAYKSAYYLDNKKKAFQLYPEIINVDYSVDKCKNLYVADFSFTFLSWRIIEKLQSNELDLKMFDESIIELICYNILPGGDTVLHKLYNNEENIIKIFRMAQPDEEKLDQIKVHIPFLQNFDQKSPMHICKDKQNLKNIDVMLKYLQGYKLDHHSRAIFDLIPYFISKQLPSLSDYLESRLMQTNAMKTITKGNIPDDLNEISTQQLWFDHLDLQRKMKDDNDQDEDIEMPVIIELIDMPKIYHLQDRLSDEFYDQLARTDQYEIFEEKTIRKLIEFNYPLVKKWTIIKLFVPFVVFQSLLFFYLNFIFEQNTPVAKIADFPLQILLSVFSIYFLRNELTQCIDEGFHYFSSVWNYIDIITPVIILSLLVINGFDIQLGYNLERILQAIGVFFMWFKFLYFFRIFKSFGYLTRLIILVIYDMRHFLIVLFFTIVAFSDSFLTLSNGNVDDNDKFVTGFLDSIIYTYRIILGDFDVEKFGNVGQFLVYGLFILCTVFNTIVMLNLLIAIISETFSMVKENSENASYQEMASMIGENAYLIPKHIRETYATQNAYLMIITEIDGSEENTGSEIVQKLDKLKSKMVKENKEINKKILEVQNTLQNHEMMMMMMIKNQEQILNKIEQVRTGKSPDDNIGNEMSRIGSESSFKIPRTPAELGGSQYNSKHFEIRERESFFNKQMQNLNQSYRYSTHLKKSQNQL